MSSLLSQVFDPAFIFNAIYHNVAKLVNRKILTSNPKPLTKTQRVPKCILEKHSQLFFETQKLNIDRYALIPETLMASVKIYIIGLRTKLLHIMHLSSVM